MSNEKRTPLLINVAVLGHRNVIEKEAEKILRYKDRTTEIQHKWNVKTTLIPVILGTTGTISKSFIKYLSIIPEKYNIKELQKTVILGTACILQKVSM
jgi:hypothetical protein